MSHIGRVASAFDGRDLGEFPGLLDGASFSHLSNEGLQLDDLFLVLTIASELVIWDQNNPGSPLFKEG